MIERERADEIGRAGETDDADAVIGPGSMNFETTDFTMSSRLAGWPSSLKSSASIEPEQSSARIMSTPLASTVELLRPNCGRASADDEKPSARRPSGATIGPRGCASRGPPAGRCRRWNISRRPRGRAGRAGARAAAAGRAARGRRIKKTDHGDGWLGIGGDGRSRSGAGGVGSPRFHGLSRWR